MPITWKNGEPTALLAQIQAHRSQAKDGNVSYTGGNLDTEMFLLASAIEIKGEHSVAEKRKWISKAMFAAVTPGGDLGSTILRYVEQQRNEYAQRPTSEYVVISSCSVAPNSTMPSVRLTPDMKMTFPIHVSKHISSARAHLRREHGIPGLPESTSLYRYVKVKCRAQSPQMAIERAAEHADVRRAIWNFYLNRGGNWRWSSSTSIEPVNRITLGYLHTVHYPDGTIVPNEWWFQPEYQKPIRPIDLTAKLPNLQKFTRLVCRRIEGLPYSTLLRRAFSLYGAALDESDMNESFHKLWSVLEQLTGAKGGDGGVLKRRACAIWRSSALAELSIESLRTRRNELIHEGKDDQNGELCVYMTKQFVEAMFEFHLTHGARLGGIAAVEDFLDLHRYLRSDDGRRQAIYTHARRYYIPRRRAPRSGRPDIPPTGNG